MNETMNNNLHSYKFNIYQYTSEIEPADKFNDVFEELESIHKSNIPRRFSFSIPNEDKETEQTSKPQLQIPPVPPSSPQIKSTLQAPVIMSEEDFYLDNSEIVVSSDEEETKINDSQFVLDFSKNDLLITPDNDRTLYKIPPRKSFDARHIWKVAKIPRVSYIRDIESLVLDWAFTYAHLEISNKKIQYITWKSKSHCLCKSSWKAFLRWLVCASVST